MLTLHIIPVIDLLNGVVVHAKQGARQHYLPIQSMLTASQQPLDIVAALLNVYPFQQLYIADLNAIQQQGDNFHLIRAISERFPQLKLWIDAGMHSVSNIAHSSVVLGSENFSAIETYLSHKNQFKNNVVLSLDFMPNGYQGPAELLANAEHWPQDVIVMTLANVGANNGVNEALLQKIMALAAEKNVYAAGGIRNIDDLQALASMRLAGALVATALHQKQLTKLQMESLNQ